MTVKMIDSLSKRQNADALILPFFEGGKGAFNTKGVESLFKAPLKTEDFKGKSGELLILYPSGGKEPRVVLVGLGKENKVTKETLRRGFGSAIGALKGKAKSVNLQIPEIKTLNEEEVSVAVGEGVFLANYIFDRYKSKKEKAVSTFHFIGGVSKALKRAEIVSESVNYTRDLVFDNANVVTPTFLAKKGKELAAKYAKFKVTVLHKKEIKGQKLGLIEAVSQGASEEPALILMEYQGAPRSKEITALVGKGVTYDTGGLNLKPTGFIETMRDDMAGAAAVLGTMNAIAALKLPINVVGAIGSVENAIGPDSYKPGDVFKGYGGITVEITNTDAEGRLVLADVLSYVQKKYGPKRMIDIATLTGGALIALGEEVSALMSNNDQLTKQLIEAGEDSYERVSPLPLHEEYEELLKSKVADIKNSGTRKASAIQGGIFLKKFIEKGSWAHIDIAGTAFPDQLKSYQPVQATGVGVRLLTTFLEGLCE